MKYTYSLLLGIIFGLSNYQMANADSGKDRRAMPITRTALTTGLRSVNLDIEAKEDLISRAAYSHLTEVAYDVCSSLWREHSDLAEANLLRGVASGKLNIEKYQGSPDDELWNISKVSLAEAYRLDPKSPEVMLEYGWFIWNYSIDRDLGKKLVDKALLLLPNSPRAHTIEGSVLATPGTKYVDTTKAIDEIEVAIKLDPTYAYAHKTLWSVYGGMRRAADAEREKAIANDLVSYPEIPAK